MAKNLNQLYAEATGLTNVDVENIVADIKSGKLEESVVTNLLWSIPGGNYIHGAEFKEALFAALGETSIAAADITGDGVVTDDDVEAFDTTPVDVDGDEDIDDNDKSIIETLVSTAEVIADETVVEE